MKLETLYSKIPDVKCVENCGHCCSPIYMLPSEARKLGLGEQLYTDWTPSHDCVYKTPEGCSVYANRPFICRFFGCSDHGMFSCNKVTGNLISEGQANALLRLYAEIIIGSKNEPGKEILDAMHKHDQLMDFRGIKLTRLLPGETPYKHIATITDKPV